MDTKWEVIFEVGTEGGSLGIYGARVGKDKWIFSFSRDESTLMDFMDNDDARDLASLLRSNSGIVETLEEAFLMMDRYQWSKLRLLDINPHFVEEILDIISRRVTSPKELRAWENRNLPKRDNISRLARLLRESYHTIVFTGAGMSTESGIPDFRSKDGWWKNIDPRTVASTEALNNNYPLFHEFYSMRIKGLEQCKPHIGHRILADWEKRDIIHSVVTQNVDGFHGAAGSMNVHELHGSIHSFRCHSCGKASCREDFLGNKVCSVCGGKLRPNVVLFGEGLPPRPWNDAEKGISRAELVIVIGTSLEVYPANMLPFMAKGKIVVINKDETPMDDKFHFAIRGSAGEVLEKVSKLI